MAAFLKARGFKGAGLRTMLERLGHGDDGEMQLDALPHDDPTFEANLAWHVRAWGRRVLAQSRKDLAPYYPTYAGFEALKPGRDFERRPMRLLDVDENGRPRLGPLNAGFDDTWLKDPRNPRWVAKPPVAYLWARTVRCKGCRATLPLLKTRWLCRKDNKRVLLAVTPNAERTGVAFGVETDVPRAGNNAAQRREHDKRIGAGTMSRSGARCPCCPAIMTMEDIRFEGRAGRLGATMTAVVVDGPKGKEYRPPEDAELCAAEIRTDELDALYSDIPFGLPIEPTPLQGPWSGPAPSPWRTTASTSGPSCSPIGSSWRWERSCGRCAVVPGMRATAPEEWREGVVACLALSLGRLADRGSALATWTNDPEKIRSTFARFALPVVWGLRGVLSTHGHDRGLHSGSGVDRPGDRASARRGEGCARRDGAASICDRSQAGRLRRSLHRSTLLRRHPLFGLDGLLLRLAAPRATWCRARVRARFPRTPRAEMGWR